MQALSIQTAVAEAKPVELLTASEWAPLLVMAGKATSLEAGERNVRRLCASAGQTVFDGGKSRRVFPSTALPADYLAALEAVREQRHARTFAGLLTAAVSTTQPEISVAEMSDYSATKATRVKDALTLYFGQRDLGEREEIAAEMACTRYKALSGESVSLAQLRRWAQTCREHGGIDRCPLQFLGDKRQGKVGRKPLATVLRNQAPAGVDPETYDFEAFLRHACALAVKEGMKTAMGVHHALELRWMMQQEVPGLGMAPRPAERLPITPKQLASLLPGAASRKLGAQGKFRAVADGALPTVRTSRAEMWLCQEYQLDDTRCDFVVLDNINGKPVTLKLYVMIEVATGRIVAWCVRRAGNFTAADTGAVIARGLRDGGMAPEGADYLTTVRVENGAVACPPDRALLLEAMYPGRLKIVRTGMERGALAAGGWNADGKGKYWQKGHVEAFNKAFGLLSLWVAGQRGSNYREQPATLGTSGVDRSAGTGELAVNPGTMLAEAQLSVRAAKMVAYLSHLPESTADHAYRASKETGIAPPLPFEDEGMEAISSIIAQYNAANRHQRGGYKEIWMTRHDGSRERVKESANQRWQRLLGEQSVRGMAPVRIALTDIPMFLMRADKVTVTPRGVVWKKRTYFSPFSRAIARAQEISTLSIECLALGDPESPEHLFLLTNSIGGHRSGADLEGKPVLWETLPLECIGKRGDAVSEAAAAKQKSDNHKVVYGTFARAAESGVAEQEKRRDRGMNAMVDVVSTVLGIDATTVGSKLGDAYRLLHSRRAEQQGTPTERAVADLRTVNAEARDEDSDPTREPEDSKEQRAGRRAEALAAAAELQAAAAALMALTDDDTEI